MTLETIDLTPSIGTEIKAGKADLLAGRHSPAIKTLLEQRGVLLVRELGLSDEEQQAFAATLGPLNVQNKDGVQKITLDPELSAVADYLHATVYWHIDGAQDEVPSYATLLTMRVMSQTGGQTEFANTYAAYEALPDDKKAEVAGIRVIHTQENIQRELHPDPTEEQLARWRRHKPQNHPLAWTHRTGRKSLVLGLTAMCIEGMEWNEGRKLLAEYQAWATRPEFVYRHHWSVGDLIIWDNTGVMHRVEQYPADSGRLLSRTTLEGEEPIQ